MSSEPRPGTKAYRDRLRQQLALVGVEDAQLATLVARDLMLHGLRPREAWRTAAELTQDEAAARFNQVTGNPAAPMRGSRICEYEKWPHGGVRPPVRALKVLATVYGTSWDHLVDVADLRHMPDTDRAQYLEHRPLSGTGQHTLSASNTATRLTDQPRARRASADDGVAAFIAAVAEESQELGEWAEMANTTATTLDHYGSQIRRLAHEYVSMPPFPLFTRCRNLRDRVFGKLQGRQRPEQTQQLYLYAAQACGLLAWMSGDLGNHAAAQTHAWTAWVCADQAGHDTTRAWVRATQSKLAYWDGCYLDSAQLAEDGLGYTCPDSARVLLALLHARALARTGQPSEAAAALAQADTERDSINQPDDVGGLWGCSDAQYHYLTGSTHLWRHDPNKAFEASSQAIELFEATPAEERFYGAEMLARIEQAWAHLQRHDLDGAAVALRPVLDVPAEQRLDTFTQSLDLIRQTLADVRHSPTADSLYQEIDHYRRETIGKQLSSQ